MAGHIDIDEEKVGLSTIASKHKPKPFFCIWSQENVPELKVTICYPDDFLLEKLGSEEYNNFRKTIGMPYKENGKIMFEGKEIESNINNRKNSIDIKKEMEPNCKAPDLVKENE